MTHGDDKEIQEWLKRAFPAVDQELQRDLWPAILGRLEAPRAALPWYDWAIMAALGGWILFYPEGVLQLLYHL